MPAGRNGYYADLRLSASKCAFSAAGRVPAAARHAVDCIFAPRRTGQKTHSLLVPEMEKKHWSRHLTTVILVLAFTVFMLMRGGCPQLTGERGTTPSGASIEMLKVDGWPLYVEIADTPQLHREGLSGRRELPPGYGILFVLESPGRPAVLMKDTTIALSAAFIDEDSVITEIRELTPLDMQRVMPQSPVKYILGVRKGFFRDHGIGPGAGVQLPESASASASASPSQ